MDYYYDVKVNFLKENSFFYEWLDSDCIEKISKIPIFQISKKTFKDLYINNVQVNKEFLKLIENKTIPVQKNKYTVILATKNNAYVYKFDKKGNIVGRSSLKLIDELNILEYLYTIKNIKISYKIINKLNYNNELRYIVKIKEIINAEIDLLYKNNNFAKLRYIYLEWFGKKENDINNIYKDMKKKMLNFNNEDIRIYDLIKLSYNNV